MTNADVKVLDATYEYGTDAVSIESITGQPNCYVVTLTDITVQFAMNLYDDAGRPVATIYPTAVYLPSETTAPTYDEDTNPSSVELEVFAPYGLSYDTTGDAPTPVINEISFSSEGNMPRQGLNLYQMAKILDFNTDDSTATVGLTMILQSLYYAGYQVTSRGRIDVPKGNIGGSSFVFARGQKKTRIECTTLDDWVKENNISRVDFIKADIEGAERYLLAGAQETLRRFKPRLAICTYHLPDDPQVLAKLIKLAVPEYHVIQKRKKLYAYVG